MTTYLAPFVDWLNRLPLDEEFGYVNQLCAGLAVSFTLSAFALLAGLTAPYGRYARGGVWGCLIPGKPAWIIQEIPNQILLGFFCYHYIYRTLIFPLRLRGGKPTAFVPFLMAFVFCTINGYLQGRALTYLYTYPDDWLQTPQFLIGSSVFALGSFTNFYHDSILINLRKPGKTDYKIPRGGLFQYVSGANFLGEIIEWTGFAIACWNMPAACFAMTTFLNIGPRAVQHHQWYLNKFKGEYPSERKALIPFIW